MEAPSEQSPKEPSPEQKPPTIGVLEYRKPQTDPSVPTALDVLKGAAAIALALGWFLGGAAMSWKCLLYYSGPNRLAIMATLVFLTLGGAACSFLTIRDYLTGRNRRRRLEAHRAAAEPPALERERQD